MDSQTKVSATKIREGAVVVEAIPLNGPSLRMEFSSLEELRRHVAQRQQSVDQIVAEQLAALLKADPELSGQATERPLSIPDRLAQLESDFARVGEDHRLLGERMAQLRKDIDAVATESAVVP